MDTTPRKELPLTSLLALRLSKRDTHRSQLAECQRKLAQSTKQLQRIVVLLEDLDQRTDRYQSSDIVSISQLAQIHRYRAHLWQGKQSLKLRCEQLDEEVETQRQELIEADREVQVLEKLRKNRLAQQQQQQALQEVRVSDDVAGRWSYRGRSAA
jgi:flagellar export protein FliJ